MTVIAFIPAPLLLLLLVGAASIAWVRTRRLRLQGVLQTLALVVGQNLPLAPALRAAARHELGRTATIYNRLARQLEMGDPLSSALRLACPSCPGRIVGALLGAEQGGTLPSVLRCLAADLRREALRTSRLAPAAAYFLLLLIVVPAATLAIGVFLFPRFREILLDFGVENAPHLERITAVAGFVAENAVWFVAAVLALLILAVQTFIVRQFFPRVPDRFQSLAALVDTIAWFLPLVRRVTETRALARQLPLLQAGIRAGHDLAPAARQAACVDANYHARRRLRRWAERIEAGTQPVAAARAVGLPAALRSALTAARDREELLSGLDYLCSYYRSLLAHWEHILASVALPIVVIGWGSCIGYLVFAVFSVLYGIVDSIVGQVW